MFKATRSAVLLAFPLLFTACFNSSTSSTSETAPVYVAMGNSLTAGFQSGGLRADFQKASYPALLAAQMGITDFQMPLVDSPGIGSTPGFSPLFLDANGNPTMAPIPAANTLLSNVGLSRAYNNLGVPGATTSDVLNAYDSATSQVKGNAFFNVVIRGGFLNNTTMLHQAISLKPDIITLWIGANDILGGITAGTVIIGQTVTPTSVYSGLMDQILDSLMTKTTAHIFMANVPSITTIPFVTTVPRFVFNPQTFVADTTTPLLTDEDSVKYVLLPALAEILKGNGFPTDKGGTGAKLAAKYTLTQKEADDANALTDGYNAYLAAKASANASRITLVDMNALLKKLAAHQITDLSGVYYKFDPLHTAFSYDGIHPNAKGYRQVANAYLDAINTALSKNYAMLQ